MNIVKPIILTEKSSSLKDLRKLKREEKIWSTKDIFKSQLIELFEITNPGLNMNSKSYKQKLQRFIATRMKHSANFRGDWVYYPWSGNLVHMVNESDYLELRTNRNKNLITKSEQNKLYNSCIGVVGLSVGSAISVGLQYQGIAKNMKLAEFDILETTNLNRIRAGVHHIGMKKTDISLQQIYEINPYANIECYSRGLKEKHLVEFINRKPRPKVIFEIVDDFEMKVRIRMEARKAGIPVVGPANLGDRVLFDIERYDLDRDLELFNGRLGELPEQILDNPDVDKNVYAVKMVEPKNIPKRAIDSVGQIGKTLVGRPQLSNTISISGALGVYFARKIILGEKLKSGRYLIDIEKLFE